MMSERNQLISILILGILGILAIGGSIVLAAYNKPTPEPLTALGGVVAGALATFIVMNRTNGKGKENQ